MACNDYIILESCIYRILKKHFAGKSYYPLLLDFFHEVGHHSSSHPHSLNCRDHHELPDAQHKHSMHKGKGWHERAGQQITASQSVAAESQCMWTATDVTLAPTPTWMTWILRGV